MEEKKMSELLQSIQENVIFLLQFLAVVIGLFLVAYAAEKYAAKRAKTTERILSTRKIAMIGMFSAIAAVLMLFEIPMPFAPGFYKLDFSELPALIAAFAFGPVAGVMVEFCKIVLKLLFKSTSTAFVGELANFAVGCSFLLPASIIYLFNKTKKTAVLGCITGTLCMPMEALIGMGTAINGAITGITSFVCFAVAPLNLIKGASVSIITLLVYKQLSPILKETATKAHVRESAYHKAS